MYTSHFWEKLSKQQQQQLANVKLKLYKEDNTKVRMNSFQARGKTCLFRCFWNQFPKKEWWENPKHSNLKGSVGMTQVKR